MERQPEGAGPETTGNQEHEQHEEHEVLREDGPRIYVASLSDYNAGILHGTWIDVAQERDQLQERVDAMLERSPSGQAEEFAVHDYEGFGQYGVDEYDSLDWLSRIARGIHEHGLAFAAWAARVGHGEAALDRFEDAYLGDWSSVEAYAEDLMDNFDWQDALYNQLPAGLHPYVKIDIEGFARDLELSGDITTANHADGVWIFDGRI
jgi:antirestriction protein